MMFTTSKLDSLITSWNKIEQAFFNLKDLYKSSDITKEELSCIEHVFHLLGKNQGSYDQSEEDLMAFLDSVQKALDFFPDKARSFFVKKIKSILIEIKFYIQNYLDSNQSLENINKWILEHNRKASKRDRLPGVTLYPVPAKMPDSFSQFYQEITKKINKIHHSMAKFEDKHPTILKQLNQRSAEDIFSPFISSALHDCQIFSQMISQNIDSYQCKIINVNTMIINFEQQFNKIIEETKSIEDELDEILTELKSGHVNVDSIQEILNDLNDGLIKTRLYYLTEQLQFLLSKVPSNTRSISDIQSWMDSLKDFRACLMDLNSNVELGSYALTESIIKNNPLYAHIRELFKKRNAKMFDLSKIIYWAGYTSIVELEENKDEIVLNIQEILSNNPMEEDLINDFKIILENYIKILKKSLSLPIDSCVEEIKSIFDDFHVFISDKHLNFIKKASINIHKAIDFYNYYQDYLKPEHEVDISQKQIQSNFCVETAQHSSCILKLMIVELFDILEEFKVYNSNCTKYEWWNEFTILIEHSKEFINLQDVIEFAQKSCLFELKLQSMIKSSTYIDAIHREIHKNISNPFSALRTSMKPDYEELLIQFGAFSKQGLQAHIDMMIPEASRPTYDIIFIESFPPWQDKMKTFLAEFEKVYGYKPICYFCTSIDISILNSIQLHDRSILIVSTMSCVTGNKIEPAIQSWIKQFQPERVVFTLFQNIVNARDEEDTLKAIFPKSSYKLKSDSNFNQDLFGTQGYLNRCLKPKKLYQLMIIDDQLDSFREIYKDIGERLNQDLFRQYQILFRLTFFEDTYSFIKDVLSSFNNYSNMEIFILLDLQIPVHKGEDPNHQIGYELLRRIQKNTRIHVMPVSSIGTLQQIKELVQTGCAPFIKDTNFREVVSIHIKERVIPSGQGLNESPYLVHYKKNKASSELQLYLNQKEIVLNLTNEDIRFVLALHEIHQEQSRTQFFSLEQILSKLPDNHAIKPTTKKNNPNANYLNNKISRIQEKINETIKSQGFDTQCRMFKRGDLELGKGTQGVGLNIPLKEPNIKFKSIKKLNTIKLLLVEDTPEWITVIKQWIEQHFRTASIQVSIANNQTDALTYVTHTKPDIICLDMHLGNHLDEGLDIWEKISHANYHPKILIPTSNGNREIILNRVVSHRLTRTIVDKSDPHFGNIFLTHLAHCVEEIETQQSLIEPSVIYPIVEVLDWNNLTLRVSGKKIDTQQNKSIYKKARTIFQELLKSPRQVLPYPMNSRDINALRTWIHQDWLELPAITRKSHKANSSQNQSLYKLNKKANGQMEYAQAILQVDSKKQTIRLNAFVIDQT